QNVQYDYTYDTLGRPTKLTQYLVGDVVSNAQYGEANQLLQMSYGPYTETRSYNTNLQLTRQQVTGTSLPSVDLQYTYSTSQNNGRITQASSTLGTAPAEVVTYQYDVLNRLSSASASGATPWSYTYAYDGFGNRTQQGGQTLQYNNAK